MERDGQEAPEPTSWLARLSVPMRVGAMGGVPMARRISRAYAMTSAAFEEAMASVSIEESRVNASFLVT